MPLRPTAPPGAAPVISSSRPFVVAIQCARFSVWGFLHYPSKTVTNRNRVRTHTISRPSPSPGMGRWAAVATSASISIGLARVVNS